MKILWSWLFAASFLASTASALPDVVSNINKASRVSKKQKLSKAKAKLVKQELRTALITSSAAASASATSPSPSLSAVSAVSAVSASKKVSCGVNESPSSASASASALSLALSVPVSVKAILIPRSINIQLYIRILCSVAMALSLLKCYQTAGIPHIRTIWDLVYGSTSMMTKMPNDYRPSSLDIELSRIIASGTHELLPPITLPLAGPVLGLVASTLVLVGTTMLLPRWFTSFQVYLDYRKLKPTSSKSMMKIVEQEKGACLLVNIEDKTMQQDLASSTTSSDDDRMKSAVICPLLQSSQTGPVVRKRKKSTKMPKNNTIDLQYSHPYPHFFELNQCRIYFDASTGCCQDGGPLLQVAPLAELKALMTHGLTKSQRVTAEERYMPYNRPQLASPSIREAFYARVSSPLVVVQLVGRLLSCLEEGVRSLANTAFTVGHHYTNARQAIIAARQMAQEVQKNIQDTSTTKVLVLRNGKTKKWVPSTAGDLLPGDIFVITHAAKDELVIPVDALLLDGQSLTNEAVLTGESVPQSKMPIDFDDELSQADAILDMYEHRSSILFAGTTLVHCSSETNKTTIQGVAMPPHKTSGVTCLALRTGTYSSKGQLLRTLKSSTHVGAISNAQSEKDSMRLIASLSVFAAASCISLFVPGAQQQSQCKVSVFRRIVQCTRIAIASIPSDLPLALSAVARSCSKQLREDSDVICAEPGSLLTAAYVDTVVFDKTGTLTADTQSLSKLVSKMPKTKVKIAPTFQKFLLAGCHSLVQLETSSGNSVVGDPLDLVSLQYSGWKYNRTGEFYFRRRTKSTKKSDPLRLWQIKSFPFDPNRRLSSALVLAETADNHHYLSMLTKGSPETMKGLYHLSADISFKKLYDTQTQALEAQGFRSIALGSCDLSNSSLADELFPDGLSSDDHAVQHARSMGASLRRNKLEAVKQKDGAEGGLEFCGLACFDASVRPSSKRVIDELIRGGLRPIMLTGDAIDAALTVAWGVNLIKERNVAILETSEDGNSEKEVRWRIVKLKSGKDASVRMYELACTEIVTVSSVKNMLKRHKKGDYAIAATGQALEIALEASSDKALGLFVDNLLEVSVIARATPSLKKSVITTLKRRCGQKVMMCGDGVNDVAAMKAADVAVALLNGFGSEETEGQEDIDDERHKKKLALKKIGSNRLGAASARFGQGRQGRDRLKVQIEKSHDEIKQRAAARLGLDGNSTEVPYDLQDLKDMVSVTVGAVNAERRRSRSLKTGGGDAARILAEERRNRSSTLDDEEDVATSTIKPGEASLVASFSCLHPSIDGVYSILKSGVATAACALATQEMIALQSLMSCYHLASLYRDGFRYGKNMWPIELTLFMLVDQARYKASCTTRPRLPESRSLRPAESMFHPSCIFSTVVQAAIHLVSMGVGVNYARRLEGQDRVKAPTNIHLAKGHPDKLAKLMGALAERGYQRNDDGEETAKMFRRPPFRPNYETNVVFVFSVLQTAVSCLANHKGKPFYRSVLESRELCFVSALTALFSLACVAETFPIINQLLELRPMPSRQSKFVLLGIGGLNVLACFFCRLLSDKSLNKPRMEYVVEDDNGSTAADMEERLLREESKHNSLRVTLVVAVMGYLVLELLAKPHTKA